MLFDVLIPNMMLFYCSNNYKTSNIYPITIGGNAGNWGFWVGDLPPLSHSAFHLYTPNWFCFVKVCQLIMPQVITYCKITLELLSTSLPPLWTLFSTKPVCILTWGQWMKRGWSLYWAHLECVKFIWHPFGRAYQKLISLGEGYWGWCHDSSTSNTKAVC